MGNYMGVWPQEVRSAGWVIPGETRLYLLCHLWCNLQKFPFAGCIWSTSLKISESRMEHELQNSHLPWGAYVGRKNTVLLVGSSGLVYNLICGHLDSWNLITAKCILLNFYEEDWQKMLYFYQGSFLTCIAEMMDVWSVMLIICFTWKL